MQKKKVIRSVISIVLIAFALLTIFMSSSVLFDWFGIRAKQGNYVPFVVKTNLTAAFLYLFAVYALIKKYKWAFWIMLSAALLLIYASVLFYVHIHTGGLHETRTSGALIFRVVFTVVMAFLIYIINNREESTPGL